MSESSSLPLFLLSVVLLSLSGVMMPGPVTAVTIWNGAHQKTAGALVAVGHGLIEVPIIVLAYFGFARFLDNDALQIVLGILGGLVLIGMAVFSFRNRTSFESQPPKSPRSSVTAGLLTTATNPYFYAWWALVGALLLTKASAFGTTGVVAMGAAHWLCDASWLLLISFVVFKSKRLWTPTVHRGIFLVCGLTLAGFGVYFVYSGISLAAGI